MPPKRRILKGEGIISDAIDKVRSWFFPPNRLSASSNSAFEKYKDKVVKDITIRRAPIIPAVDRVLNFISSGRFDQAKRDSGFDKMFHLGVIVTLSDGTKVIIEKNERINISTSWSNSADTTYKSTNYNGSMTLAQLMERTEKLMGTFKFYQYNAYENNCQDFVLGIIRAAGAATADTTAFVKQSTKRILETMPWYVKKFSQFATDTAAKANQIIGGRGRKKRRKVVKKKVAAPRKRTVKKRVIKKKL